MSKEGALAEGLQQSAEPKWTPEAFLWDPKTWRATEVHTARTLSMTGTELRTTQYTLHPKILKCFLRKTATA